ncbi:MAG: hypothetical protein AAGK01_11060, partial [Pseudomonadota bacterium]
RLTGDPITGTNAGFVLTATSCLIAAILWRNRPLPWLKQIFIRTLGMALVALPVLRLQTGGLSWGEALVQDADMLLFIELLCLMGGATCLWLSRPAPRLTTDVAAE